MHDVRRVAHATSQISRGAAVPNWHARRIPLPSGEVERVNTCSQLGRRHDLAVAGPEGASDHVARRVHH
eukprot:10468567-Alexandrium_andersonii.AAC.1